MENSALLCQRIGSMRMTMCAMNRQDAKGKKVQFPLDFKRLSIARRMSGR